jgi:hypothetical protein
VGELGPEEELVPTDAPCSALTTLFAFSNSSCSFELLLKALLQLLKQPLLHHSILCRAVFPEGRVT